MASPLVLSDITHGSAVPDYRLSDARITFTLSYRDTVLAIQEPVGWDAAEWSLERDRDYHGLNFEFIGDNAELKIREPAAITLLDAAFAKDGPDALVYLTWTLSYQNQNLPIQKLQFVMGKRRRSGLEFACPAERVSLHPDIRANWSTELSLSQKVSLITDPTTGIAINITPPAPVTTLLHAQTLRQKLQTFQTSTGDPTHTATAADTDWVSFDGPERIFYLSLPLSNPDPDELPTFSGSGISVSDEPVYGFATKDGSLADSPIAIFRDGGAFRFEIDIDVYVDLRLQKRTISFDPPEIDDWSLTFYLKIGVDPAVVIGQPLTGHKNSRFLDGVRFVSGVFIHSANLLAGAHVYIYGEMKINPDARSWKGTDVRISSYRTRLYVEADTSALGTSAKAYTILDALNHQVALLTGQTGMVKSGYYSPAGVNYPADGYGYRRVLASGYGLRNFSTTGSTVTTTTTPTGTVVITTLFPSASLPIAPTLSFQKLLSSLQAIDAVGMAYRPTTTGDELVIEPIRYFYRDTVILTLDSYTIIEEKTDETYIASSVEVGYSKYADQGVQVLDEFNTKQTYASPTRSGAPVSYLSDVIASGYAIELTRRNQFEQTPQDSTTYDEDTFIVCAYPAGGETVTVTGYFGVIIDENKVSKPYFACTTAPIPAGLVTGAIISVTGGYNNNTFTILSLRFQPSVPGGGRGPGIAATLFCFLDKPVTLDGPGSYIINFGGSVWKAERNEDFGLVYGITNPDTAYNLKLAPRYNLLRHGPYIAGGLDFKSPSEFLRCASSLQNGKLVTQLTAHEDPALLHPVIHTSNPTLAALRENDPVWTADTLSIETKLTIDQMLYIRACLQGIHPDPTLNYGCIALRKGTSTVRGHVLSVKYTPVTGKAVFVLLKKFLTLADQTQGGCEVYRSYTFSSFENLPAGSLPAWIEQCRFSNFTGN